MIPGRVVHDDLLYSIDEFGRNKLHYAANNGNLVSVTKLLGEGINIDAQDDIGWTALHFAAQNNHFKTIELLLEYKANPNIHDKQGNGPLWTAGMNVKKGNYQAVVALLKAKANPNHSNHHGRSPLYIAKTMGDGLEEAFAKYAMKE
ncbi:MAG: ankyrin repeat domain-containing protein [Gammaproteobacteria bacterium]|nr:ankyrin repeat domain-containing protein [Gammaproteobacteria bacterium]MCW8987341.1 ankyrin repeat domain-containing protein [Gammaproteobacteria bacterium]MCW9030542.1 ankyrin repeat domain-containing protein [Gammaproteobacteria bacterium]